MDYGVLKEPPHVQQKIENVEYFLLFMLMFLFTTACYSLEKNKTLNKSILSSFIRVPPFRYLVDFTERETQEPFISF